jgi:hypothetical protein
VHWFVEVCERFGTRRPAEADEWRRRIAARRAFLDLRADGDLDSISVRRLSGKSRS